jgi:hypothetical protein
LLRLDKISQLRDIREECYKTLDLEECRQDKERPSNPIVKMDEGKGSQVD